MAKRRPQPEPIGEALRGRRVEILKKGLREMARHLDIAPAHLTDIENGRRNPSEELLVKMAVAYGVPEADLRAGFGRPEAIVSEVASESPVNAEKVPAFLRTARGLTPDQWDKLIEQAKRMSKGGEERAGER